MDKMAEDGCAVLFAGSLFLTCPVFLTALLTDDDPFAIPALLLE
jgi:hypothetical protein